jgi:Zn-dependent protease with chaperone function
MSKLKCTTEEADAVQLYLWELRDALGLQQWDVYLSSKAAAPECHASVFPTEGRWVAEVRVQKDFCTALDDDQKRAVLTHELLHLVHRDLTEVTRKSLLASGYLPHRVYRMHWEQLRLEAELMVDHLTSVVALTMPAWTGRSEAR